MPVATIARLMAVWFFILFWASPAAGADNTLLQASLGVSPDYTRLIFTFQNPLDSYVVRRDDVDRVVVDFGPVQKGQAAAPPPGDLIKSAELVTTEGRLTAVLELNSIRYELRHFSSRDKYSVIIDLKNLEAERTEPVIDETGEMKPLKIPSLADVARRLSLVAPPQTEEGPADNLMTRILGELEAQDFKAAQGDLAYFLELFPDHPAAEYVSYLKAEVDFRSGPPAETYGPATEQWKLALERWPVNVLAPRARFMLAEADRLMGYNNEAAAKFKIMADDALEADSAYAPLALLRASDLLMNMGLIDEARIALEPVLSEGRGDRLGLEAYARLGLADFYQGFYSQANEIFREALRLNPNLYQTFPDMLYAAGEGYHYLGRPDLSTLYLFHALNLMPDHPKADVMLARIGDNYRKQGRDQEAMAVYGAAQRNFPNGDGGLISQVRLADMGALHSFFTQDRVFDALERGSRQATVEMYKKIVEVGSASPLLQLAQLKIGTAMAEDGENAEAVKWLRDLEINHPKSTLLPEALPVLNRALVEEITLREELEDWPAIADLYADNSSYLEDEDRPQVMRTVARAYEKLGRFNEAREVWQDLEEQEPPRRLARYRGLVINSLKMGQPMDALNYILEMAKEFPEEQDWMDLQLAQVGRDLARPGNAGATANLLTLAKAIKTEPVRMDALADAIEIEINGRRYETAWDLMDQYRREYPEDELTPEYLLTQAKIADYEKRPDQAWNLLSDFRILYPDDPRTPTLILDQIEQANTLGRPDDAFRFTELYRERYPKALESRAMLIDKMQKEWTMGRYDDSQNSLAAFRRDYPGDPIIPELLMERSGQDWNKGRFEAAQWAVDELLLNYPDDPRTIEYLVSRANDDWLKERYEPAQWATDTLLRLYPNDSKVADYLLARADQDWSRGRVQEAQRDWTVFRQAFPDDPRVGDSYLDQYKKSIAVGLTEPAFALADQFREAHPEDTARQADLMLEEAKDYLALGRPAEGLQMWNRFRQSFPEDPRNPDLLLIQARQELKLGRSGDAVAHYQQFLDAYPSQPNTPDVYLEIAAAETGLNQFAAAWDHLERYNTTYKQHQGRPKALLDQVDLGLRLGRLDESIELYRTFRRDYPEAPETPPTFLAQARLEIAAGRQDEAISTLEEGILTSPPLDGDPNVQALLTDLYLEVGRVEDWAALAERNLNRAEIVPANLPDRFLKFNQLAQVYAKLGRAEDAERNYDAALASRYPGVSPETLYAMANAYKQLQRPDKYASTLSLVAASGDPFWQGVANEELAAIGPQGN